ncbi:MAG: molecular chaperone TorD family protein [Rhodocyclales bacterium]|nr:molecular chaperone TorD family protein [Rhodocyclales bacterium]
MAKMRKGGEERPASALGRSRLFWLLAECLAGGFRTEVVSAFSPQPDGAADPTDPLDAAWRNLCAALSTFDAAAGDRLAIEHTRLFGGLREGAGPPPPYETVWRPGHPPGTVARSVEQAYASAGFADIDSVAGPQDHLAVELKFLALLALREAEAWRRDNEDEALTRVAQQLRFLDQHLDWVPRWVDGLASQTREPAYWALTGLIGSGLAQAADDLVAAGAARPSSAEGAAA